MTKIARVYADTDILQMYFLLWGNKSNKAIFKKVNEFTFLELMVPGSLSDIRKIALASLAFGRLKGKIWK